MKDYPVECIYDMLTEVLRYAIIEKDNDFLYTHKFEDFLNFWQLEIKPEDFLIRIPEFNKMARHRPLTVKANDGKGL